jgi:integrase
MKLTQKTVDALALPEGKRDLTFWDDECPGLAVRIQGGAKRWIVRYRPAGAQIQRQVTLGPVSGLPLRRAREKAVEYTIPARRGLDPVVAQREAATAERRTREARANRRLGLIVERYLIHAGITLRPGTVREVKRYLSVHWQAFHEQVADQLDHRAIIGRLEAIAAESGPTAANRARAYLSMCLAWGVERGLLDRNPLVGIRPVATERPRERVLTDHEVRALWLATEDCSEFSAIVRLLLLTGARRGEVADMRWPELDLDKGLWTLPAERSKNHRPHQLPLSTAVRAILSGLPRRLDRELVFGKRAGGFSGWGIAKARLDARIARQRAEARLHRNLAVGEEPKLGDGLPPWVIHDIRRTVVTGMAEIGVAPHVIEAVVNHVSGHKAGVAGAYNRAAYSAEKRIALQVWADHVMAVVADEQAVVVPLRARS